MSHAVRVDVQHEAGLAVGSGRVTGTELAEACESMVSLPGWSPGFDEVWDVTRTREIDVRPEELSELVRVTHEYADRIGTNRCVFVHTRDSVETVISLFELLTRDLPRTYHTVRMRGEAEAWLGLPPGALANPADDDEADADVVRAFPR